ncbi:hypothetical protein ASE07_13545 [Noviherbaspirillum sp. Root189]|nr:hypothetical protein ASE07_13545 [Noviherbaspirillum sp. Root189]
MNGRQLGDLVCTHWTELPTLLITGYADEAVMKNEALPEGTHLLTKPFSMNSFTAKFATLTS